MKICIPTENDNALKSIVYNHFGSSPYFVIFNTQNNELKVINNCNKEHIHGACNPLASFENDKIDILITEGIGYRALLKLNLAGVKVYKTNSEKNVEDIIKSFKNNRLSEMTMNDACRHSQGCE